MTDLSVEAGDGRLTVTWTAATHAPHGHLLRWRERSAGSGLVTVRSATSGQIITGLRNGQEYIVRVDTLGADGEPIRGLNVAASGTPDGTIQTPTAITGLSAEPGDGQLTITWTEATHAPHGYLLRWRERKPGTTLTTVSPSTSGQIITGLQNGQMHVIRVDTLDADGNIVRGTNVVVAGTPVRGRGLEFTPDLADGGRGCERDLHGGVDDAAERGRDGDHRRWGRRRDGGHR